MTSTLEIQTGIELDEERVYTVDPLPESARLIAFVISPRSSHEINETLLTS